MTRINLLPPSQLTDKHLLAEHREIKRIPNQVKRGKLKLDNIPGDYKMGTGHVKFFIDKLKFLHDRYENLHEECKSRGFNVTNFSDAWEGVPNDLYNDWTPTNRDIQISKERIKEKSFKS